jgi:hypothetical protein
MKMNIRVTATNTKYEHVVGFLTGNGAGKYTQLVDEDNKTHGVFKESVKLIPMGDEIVRKN